MVEDGRTDKFIIEVTGENLPLRSVGFENNKIWALILTRRIVAIEKEP